MRKRNIIPIDSKYGMATVDGRTRIVKILTGEPLPEDEPLILFRARDRNALSALYAYLEVCSRDKCPSEHLKGMRGRIREFRDFKTEHRDRMKQPGQAKIA